jgi:hypothetical protein
MTAKAVACVDIPPACTYAMQSTKTTEREFSAISFETSYKTIGVNLSPVWADLFVFIIIFLF